MTSPPDGCCADPAGSKALLSKDEAVQRLLGQAVPVQEHENLPTLEALGRVLAIPLVSQITVPGWDNSAMDGYALRAGDLAGNQGRLRVSQRIAAGKPGTRLEPNTAARIFTGAPIPEGADTVVIQEVCRAEGEEVILPLGVKPGANIRRAGEDIQAGAEIMAAGTRLLPQHLGLAASVGVAELNVWRRLKVAVFASGDELVMPGQPLGPGQIYNSNRFTLLGLLAGLGCETLDLGRMPDNLEATIATLTAAAGQADLVLGSGGVSVGEEDHVRLAVERIGILDLWKVAIRPGKPLAFGHLGPERTPFIGTPGNPVSLFVTFCLFARPFIRRMQGSAGDLKPQAFAVPAGFDWPKAADRMEFPRARVAPGADGQPEVRLYPRQSSGVLSSVTWADGLAVIPANQTVRRGDWVQYLPLNEIIL
ncbi:MAG: molybdopterin molybdotransferase MoeA [Chromatiaceae bacterium]|jgi:molybdopterin molybdotransferase|nr:molybdopterin molybdotransferase MoeA [Chromatiaceae bacterium]MBP8284374.1 molybdopterin molybdotransferase MoeA [Chromatiaceae bacterium]